MDRYYVWEIISYAWTEIGIEASECKSLVEKGGIRLEDLSEVDRIIFKDGRSRGPSATHEIKCCHENLHAFNY
ncbi:hypothetical protein SAMN05216210_2134 [Halopseudomonas salegens]|uniref:Uncharacterized protein n=1 Tax=Halopseudomonas salegens TaxID=1434072 RepID=A0A1H2G9W4_9GAMM|nr:hypothetical protein SAMN05216210_2134 [Halopseudomonas salegens]